MLLLTRALVFPMCDLGEELANLSTNQSDLLFTHLAAWDSKGPRKLRGQ